MEATSLPQSLSARIRSCYEDLSPTDRRLADLMLEYPGDIASYSASELARLTNVSNAAVSRFVQRLGFRNYEELRVLAREAKSWGSPLYLMNHAPAANGADFVNAHLQACADNVSGTFQQIDPAVIDAVAEAVAIGPSGLAGRASGTAISWRAICAGSSSRCATASACSPWRGRRWGNTRPASSRPMWSSSSACAAG